MTSREITRALRDLGVAADDVLFVHAGMQGALRAEGDTRAEKMDTVLDGLDAAVARGLLVLPTFTYSYCRGETYDPGASPSAVGMLSEHFRARPGVRRTLDPIFSVAVRGVPPDSWSGLFGVANVDCFGEESVFARLYWADAKLLFMSVGFEFCTFLYLVEQRLRVPYRYFKTFAGEVIDGERSASTTARYYVRDLGTGVENDFSALAADLRDRGLLRETRIPGGPRLLCCGARAVHDVAIGHLTRQPGYLVGAA